MHARVEIIEKVRTGVEVVVAVVRKLLFLLTSVICAN